MSIGEASHWYAVQTQARHERVVANRFREDGINTFLPLVTAIHSWSDRKKVVQLPLFSCYVFAQIFPTNFDRLRLLRVNGVLSLVGKRGEGTPIPDEEIETIRILIDGQAKLSPHPFLKVGQLVRIRGGALDGIKGILSSNGNRQVIVSVQVIQRSLAVRLDGYTIEAA